MTSGTRSPEWVERLVRNLCQPLSPVSKDLSSSNSTEQATSASNSIISPFRLRDLPEELQRQCIEFAIPAEWCVRATRPLQNPGSELHGPGFYQLRHVPTIPGSLYLVDKYMSSQVRAVAPRSFTGELHLDSVFEQMSFKHPPRRVSGEGTHPQPLDPLRHLVTIVHMGYFNYSQGFKGFDLHLVEVLPNLRTVVAHSENRLYEGSLYGWGDAQHLISIISDEALIRFVQRTNVCMSSTPSTSTASATIIRQLWQSSIKTLLEMKVIMGFGEMQIAFYSVFWLRKDEDPILLGKYPVDEWLKSSRLRRKVYGRAV